MVYQPGVSDIPSEAHDDIAKFRPLRRANNRWLWSAFVLNGLIGVLLAVEAYWQSKNSMSAVNLLLALWPGVLVGPLLARWFQRIRLTTFSWGIFWGVFFGMTNVLLSGLICYIWTALAETIPHWGHDWQQAGDGLRIFVSQIASLAQPALTPLLLGLWLAVLGGSLIGASIYRSEHKMQDGGLGRLYPIAKRDAPAR